MIKYSSLNEGFCKDCGGCGGHSTYEEDAQDLVYHECPTCKGTGEQEPIDENKIVYVNVYSVTRHYGGPEEGGWWYNWYECLEVYPVKNKNADIIQEELENEYENNKHGNIYSVLGGTDIDVRIEEEPKESETKERPYYE